MILLCMGRDEDGDATGLSRISRIKRIRHGILLGFVTLLGNLGEKSFLC